MCGIGAVISAAAIAVKRAATAGEGCTSAAHADVDGVANLLDALKAVLLQRGPDGVDVAQPDVGGALACTLVSAVLHLRGTTCMRQPVTHASSGNVLCWNGEVFSGLDVRATESDTTVVMQLMCELAGDVAALNARMGCVLGPWAFIFWQASTRKLIFGRDPVGRRSLLLHTPTPAADVLVLSSVAIPLHSSDCHAPIAQLYDFAELVPSGLYELLLPIPRIGTSETSLELAGEVMWSGVCDSAWAGTSLRRHRWDIRIPRFVGVPGHSDAVSLPPAPLTISSIPELRDRDVAVCAVGLLRRLSQAVRKRVTNVAAHPPLSAGGSGCGSTTHAHAVFVPGMELPVTEQLTALAAAGHASSASSCGYTLPSNAAAAVLALGLADSARLPCLLHASVAVLFSGGLDSMVIAALAHHHVPIDQPIDLFNVCFAKGHNSPDRLAAQRGLEELSALYPQRTWQLICVDETYPAALANQAHMAQVLAPALSHMDFNIGSALWYASRGVGYVDVSVVPDGEGTSVEPLLCGARDDKQLRYSAEGDPVDAPRNLDFFDRPSIGGASATERTCDVAVSTTPHDAAAGAVPPATVIAALAASWTADGYTATLAALDRCTDVLESDVAEVVHQYCTAAPADGDVVAESPFARSVDVRASSAIPVEAPAGAEPAGDDESELGASLHASPAGMHGGSTSVPAAPMAFVPILPQPLIAARELEGASTTAVPQVQRRARPCPGVTGDGLPCVAVAPRKCRQKMCRRCCAAAAASMATGVTCPVHGVVGTGSSSALAAARVSSDTSTAGSCTAGSQAGGPPSGSSTALRVLVRSPATVILTGIGADEQMAGYARHRSAFPHGGWRRLREELTHDCARIWVRNLGRDDRVCSDHGREVRLPFLDEEVSGYLRLLPVPYIADLRLPFGSGDKRVLRVLARMLGLRECAALVKRAIHFGSRIAKQSNVHMFGSNRAGKGDATFLFSADTADSDD